jgi:hypothetical protein
LDKLAVLKPFMLSEFLTQLIKVSVNIHSAFNGLLNI